MELNFCGYLVENKWFVSLAFLAVLVPFFVTINNSYSNWKKSEQQENQSNLYKADAKKDRIALLAKNEALNIEIKKSQSQTIEKANQVIALTKKAALVTIESQNRALERITAPYIQLDNIKVSDGILSIEIENIGPNPINHIAVGAYADSKLRFEDESPKFHNNAGLPSSVSLEEIF